MAKRWGLAASYAACVGAHSHYQDSIPNGRNVPGVPFGPPGWHAVGHTAPNPASHPTYILGGFPRSSFGYDFAAAGHRWTSGLCWQDSDGDGLTNGQELGDPHCVWRVGDKPLRSHNISHPGMSPANLRSWSYAARARKAEVAPPADALNALSAQAVASGWLPGGVVLFPFTSALCYYQYVIIPLLLITAAGISSTRFGRRHAPFPRPLGVFAMYYLLFIVGVGCGVHRYFSHKAYTASRPLKRFLTILSLFVGQGSPLDWAYVHRVHHRLCEHEFDYHSPHLSDVRDKGTLVQFVYAQALWMVWPHPHVKRSPALEHFHCSDIIDDVHIADLQQWITDNPLLTKGVIGWILPGFVFAALHAAVRLAAVRLRRAEPKGGVAGWAVRPSGAALAAGGFVCGVYYFYLPVALTWMSTGFVNSATHLWGDQPFEDGMIAGCQSKNNAFLFLPMLGENWHNNHHAVPASLSTWVCWYQVDLVYLTGRFFELLGLASDIRVEVPLKLKPDRNGEPPTGFPAFIWTLSATVWALVLGVAHQLHARSAGPDKTWVSEKSKSSQ